MPSEEDLNPGALRDLVQALHELYRDAGMPSTRHISLGVRRRNDLPDTVSHEAVGSMLRGSALIKWVKLYGVVRILAENRVVADPEVEAVLLRFHALWLRAADEGNRSGPRTGRTPRVQPRTAATPPGALTPEPGKQVPPRNAEPIAPNGRPTGSVDLPPRHRAFTGREELLADVAGALRDARGRPVVLIGHGGLGKTQLALEYAHRHADGYDLVWWLPAEQPERLMAAFRRLAGALGIPARPDVTRTTAAVIERLESRQERWLLVFDNADDARTLLAQAPGFGGDVLVTTRNPDLGRLGVSVQVPVFTRQESIEYLCRRDRRLSRSDADQVAERLGDLPLALAQVSALQATTGMSVPRYLRVFDGHLEELLAQGRPDHYETTLTALVRVALDGLGEQVPAAGLLLAVLAHLDPESVPLTLLRAGARADVTPALARALADPDRAERLMTDLARSGLATVPPEGGRVGMHRLIRECVRQGLPPDALDRGRADAHALLVAADPGNPDDARNWERYGLIAPHLTSSGMLEATRDDARRLVVHHVRYLHQTGDYQACLRLAEAATDAWTDGGDEAGAGRWQLELARHRGDALRALGRYREARELTTQALERLRSSTAYGPDHEVTLRTAFGNGYDLRLTGDYAAARALDEDTYRRCLRRYGPGHRHTLTAENNLAVSLRLLGEAVEAHRHDLDVQAGWLALRGEHDVLVQRSKANLAWDLHGLGRYGEMSQQAAQALAAVHGRVPPTHVVALLARRAQVVALRAGGHWHQALEFSADVYDDHVRHLGPDSERTLLMGLTRTNALRSAGRYEAARDLAVETQQAYRRQFGWRHPGTAAASVALAAVLRSWRRLSDARRIDEEAHRDLSAALGPAHPFVVCAANGLAGDLALDGFATSAVRLLEATVVAAARAMGERHPVVLACRANLATACNLAGDPDRAERLGADAALRDALGDGHPHTVLAAQGAWVELDLEPPPA